MMPREPPPLGPKKLILTRTAEADIDSIVDYIAGEAGPEIAYRFAERIDAELAQLAQLGHGGVSREWSAQVCASRQSASTASISARRRTRHKSFEFCMALETCRRSGSMKPTLRSAVVAPASPDYFPLNTGLRFSMKARRPSA